MVCTLQCVLTAVSIDGSKSPARGAQGRDAGNKRFPGEKESSENSDVHFFSLGLHKKNLSDSITSSVLLIFRDMPRRLPYPIFYKVKEEPECFLRKSDTRMG